MNNWLVSLFFLSSDYLGYFWLLAVLFLLLLELASPGLFFFLAFALGCLCASLTTLINASLKIQCSIALLTSLWSFFLLHHYFIRKKKPAFKSNTDALINQQGIVTATINPHSNGIVKIRGEEWSASSLHKTILQRGTEVIIVQIKGNTLIVTIPTNHHH